jgi:hypothetical protein
MYNPPSTMYGYTYRCIVDGQPSRTFSLKFEIRWVSGFTGSWFSGNWNCSSYPTPETDVIIEKGKLEIYGNVRCRSLVVNPGASVDLKPGASISFN